MAKLSEEEYAKLYREFCLLAETKNGKLLSPKFYGMTKYHLWQCNKHNHTWKAKPSNLKDYPSRKGTWCPKCAIESLPQNNYKFNIKDMQKLASSKPGGGWCLSKKYKGMLEYLIWKCGSCGYVWKAKPCDIKGKPTKPEGTWCPQCAEGRFERIVRAFFEGIFNVLFPKENKLNWLSKYYLHLDGFNKELSLAFECQGIQHYQFHDHFHNSDQTEFIKQTWIDEYKRRECKKSRIFLIEVGYKWKNGKLRKLKFNEIESYIRESCKEFGITPPQKSPVDWRQFDLSLQHYVEDLRKIARERNGRLISKTYLGEVVPLLWFCNAHKFQWWAAPNDIRGKPSKPNGSWCPKCARKNHSILMKTKVKNYSRDKKGRFI